MSIDGIKAGLQAYLKQIPKIDEEITSQQIKTKDGSFGEMLQNSLKEVDSLQKQADHQVEGLMLSKDGFTPHSAMIALEKADVAFQLMSSIRAKIVRAYEEVMRTQV
jgi:flagellar hook-basal body complex protein FliE